MNAFFQKTLRFVFLIFLLLFFKSQTLRAQNEIVIDKESDTSVNLTNVATYINMVGYNLKEAFTKPFHLNATEVNQLTDFTFLIVGLGMLDEPVQKAAMPIKKNHTFLSDVSHTISGFGAEYQLYTLAALGTYSLIFKNEKLKNTTLLATQAWITAGSVGTLVKIFTGRDRPSYYSYDETASPTFHGLNKNSYSSSFPSGHTFSAFSVATVFAMEYKDKPLVPIFAYSAATLVGLSRITENKHWVTDVFAGAVLGYLSGRQAVNNYHIRKGAKKKSFTYSIGMNYSGGQLIPSVIFQLP